MKNGSDDDSDLEAFSARLRERAFDRSCCFLCAKHYDNVHLTSEHIIPRWAQKRFDLWDQRLTLLNRTEIPYRKLTVPCCEECNKYQLQPIEADISNAVSRGAEDARRLEYHTIFLWLAKIFYGILYREISLLLDQDANNNVTIASPELLREYEILLFLLQQARKKIKMSGFAPGSIFIFRCQAHIDRKLQWDFCDNARTMFMAIRMGEVGIIASLGDGGAQLTYAEAYRELADLQLHPLQFRELCAQFSYRSTLATRTPKYITVEGMPHEVIQLPLAGMSAMPYFRDWDDDVFARFLAFYTGYPYELVRPAPGKITTWLRDDSGRTRYMDIKDFPYIPIMGKG